MVAGCRWVGLRPSRARRVAAVSSHQGPNGRHTESNRDISGCHSHRACVDFEERVRETRQSLSVNAKRVSKEAFAFCLLTFEF